VASFKAVAIRSPLEIMKSTSTEGTNKTLMGCPSLPSSAGASVGGGASVGSGALVGGTSVGCGASVGTAGAAVVAFAHPVRSIAKITIKPNTRNKRFLRIVLLPPLFYELFFGIVSKF
jgi:hypothetical protein